MIRPIAALGGLLLAFNAFAQAPGGPPPGSTGMCNDGTYSTAPSKRGACAGHKGVKDWYASATTTPAVAAPAAPPAAKPGAPVPPTSPQTTPAPTKASAATPAAGGGNGQVWVNTASNVYHCAGDRWYGKTKAGQYMSEAAAKQAGARPERGKACS